MQFLYWIQLDTKLLFNNQMNKTENTLQQFLFLSICCWTDAIEPEVPSTFSIENFSKMPPKTIKPDPKLSEFEVTAYDINFI